LTDARVDLASGSGKLRRASRTGPARSDDDYRDTLSSMNDEDGYFGERVAATYDEAPDRMFDPAVVGQTVDFLAELAGDGRALELDLMAQMTGLELRGRWAGWGREPFTSDSRQHVSVWEKRET
jgi:hypothetical protein